MNKINHFLKFLLNGGSAIILTIIAVMFFSINVSFGMSIIAYTHFISFTVIIYLGVQIIQFNLAKVSTIKDAGIELQIREVALEELFEADEVFLTGTFKDILPVTEVNGKKINNGKVGRITSECQNMFNEALNIFR